MKKFAFLSYRFLNQILNIHKFIYSFPRYILFFKDLSRYRSLQGAERITTADIYPNIHEKSSMHEVDYHYLYQPIWATGIILRNRPVVHYDIGSQLNFTAGLSHFMEVVLVEFRELALQIKGLRQMQGDILHLPFEDNSLYSLSCLHVIEHIGLGRYGDPLNPSGTKEACRELARVLAIGGNLYVSAPVGKSRICFNAHRVHSPEQILSYFENLRLVSFAFIDDAGKYVENSNTDSVKNADYACGLFHFTK